MPEHRRDCTFVTGDSGQFLFDEGRVTAMLDMELGYLGDPLADLGGLFCRDLTESMGDLDVAIERYASATGRPASNVAMNVRSPRSSPRSINRTARHMRFGTSMVRRSPRNECR